MVKQDYANTLGTLLSLDRVMVADLMKLKEETLAKMYVNYIQNAKNVNHKMEQLLELHTDLSPRQIHVATSK